MDKAYLAEISEAGDPNYLSHIKDQRKNINLKSKQLNLAIAKEFKKFKKQKHKEKMEQRAILKKELQEQMKKDKEGHKAEVKSEKSSDSELIIRNMAKKPFVSKLERPASVQSDKSYVTPLSQLKVNLHEFTGLQALN